MIVSWAIENNLIYLRSTLVYDCDYDKLLVISTGWLMIMISSWAIGNNLIYFWGYSGWIYDCHSFLVISTGWHVNVVYLRGIKDSSLVIYKIT